MPRWVWECEVGHRRETARKTVYVSGHVQMTCTARVGTGRGYECGEFVCREVGPTMKEESK